MFSALLAFALAGAACAQTQSQVRDEDLLWRIPLDEKARIIQGKVYRDHWVLGTYPSQVEVYADGRPVDHSTAGYSNIAHTSSWTGSYLMGAAFRYGWAKEHGTPQDVEDALDLGGGMVNGLFILSHVSDKPGFLARGVAYGYGPSYEERHGSDKSDAWYQGSGPYNHLRFRANPSHHNHDQVTRGLAFWYYFLSKDNPNPTGRVKAQMDSVRATLRDIMEYAYKSRDLTIYDYDGAISTTLIGFSPPGRASTRVLMVTNALKYASWIVGDPWYKRKYDQLVGEYNYLQPGMAQQVRADADDTEHTLPGLWLTCQLEENEQLKAFYGAAGASLFERFKNSRWALFNYIYADLTGDTQGADLPGALQTLRLFPTNAVMYPVMNSIRTDVEVEQREGRPTTKSALPFNEIPMDNEYDWKGDPFRLDGWTARPISSFAVSGETPRVWLLSDGTQTLYQTTDGGQTFAVSDYQMDSAIRAITFAGRRSRIALLASNSGVYRTTRFGDGNSWDLVHVGPPGNLPRRFVLDRSNPNVVWAVTDDGVYRSVDLGHNEIGKLWNRVSDPLPADWKVVYGLAASDSAAIYAAAPNGSLYRCAANGRWSALPMQGYLRYGTIRQIAAVPTDLSSFLVLVGLPWGNISVVLKSADGGRTVMGTERGAQGLLAYVEQSGLGRVEITGIVVDPTAPANLYAASPKGFFRSTDGGAKWTLSNTGLRIPYVYFVHAPRETPGTLFVSTPAGLHVSSDRGQTWGQPILVLNGPGVDRLDKGGMAYLVAYWPGRYFGYVTDEQSSQAPEAWGR